MLPHEGLPIPREPDPTLDEAVSGGIGGVISAGFTLGIIWLIGLGVNTIYQSLFIRVYEVPVYVGLSIGITIIALGIVFLFLKDIRNWSSIAILQIIAASSGGIVSFLQTTGSINKGIGLVLAGFAAANGMKRLREINIAKV
jgi:hypothetical protein